MAKMFYSLEEAAEKLGVSEEQVKDMASAGKLQQFRDRDKLMFKRDAVDELSSGGGAADEAIADESGAFDLADSAIGLEDSGPLELADSGLDLGGGADDTDAIDLNLDDAELKTTIVDEGDPKEATGISVFDAGEVDSADPMAQTQMTGAADDELSLDTVGSGSGLLDLTRESDDTSLGVDLLDDILPGGEGSDDKLGGSGTLSGFDSAVSMETGTSGPSGLDNLGDSAAPAAAAVDIGDIGAGAAAAPTPVAYESDGAVDGAGSGLCSGFLIGALAALVLLLFVVATGLAGSSGGVLAMVAGSSMTIFMVAGGLLVVSLVLGAVGFFIGRSMG